MIEVRIHGRGGQGAVVASEILAIAGFYEGMFVQSFPQFGVERRGAPVVAFVKFGDKGEKLFPRCDILTPDHIVILDPVLLSYINVFEGLKKGGWVIINSAKKPEELEIPDDYKLAVVDANSIALKWKLGTAAQPIVNTAILGAFVKATGILSLDSLEKAIRQKAPVKKDENVNAAKEAYEKVIFRNK